MNLKPEDRSDLESFVLNLELEDDFASYISMPTRLFIHFDSLPFDIFIYVDSRYIKYINAKDPIDQSRINLIIEQGIDELYFEALHRSPFTQMLLTGLKKQLTFKTSDQPKHHLWPSIILLMLLMGTLVKRPKEL